MAPMTRSTDQATKPEQGAKITLYWLEQSRAQRILWLLEELNLDYELKTYKRQNMLAPEEFKKVHPLGKAPLLLVEPQATSSKPIVLAESGAIVEYLIDHFGSRLLPKRYTDGKEGQVGGDTESWLRYRFYMHFVEGSLMPLLVTMLLMAILRDRSPFFIRPITNMITAGVESNFLKPNLATQMDFMEDQIASSPDGGDYICGAELTGADILLSFPLNAAKDRAGLTKEKYPKLWTYVERLEATESYKRAVQKINDVQGSYDAKL